ncbi:PQQ-dependent sugar dehydrogenase [Flavobacterium sp.]|uniref:PQQ-dependent sugar dehydrogenase n=1 Tax=Flavobacterium sp. TaxID=239 RepID=UPI003BC06A46
MKHFFFYFFLISIIACSKKQSTDTIDLFSEPKIKIDTLLSGYEIIWGMDFFPNGDLIFNEKKGNLYIRNIVGSIREIKGLPTINSGGQGGFLDLCVHPNYLQNGWIYCTYASFSRTRVSDASWNLARFKIVQNNVSDWQILMVSNSANLWDGHYGSRIVFDSKGYVFVSVGEGGITSYGGASSPNLNAQNVQSTWGKVHRLYDDGTVPFDNPILKGNAGPTSIYSYGHRNPQGLAINPSNGDLWEGEHGPKGGDELNIIKNGANYGWPLVSTGLNYDGTVISSTPLLDGIEPAIYTWTPSIAPSGMTFITSNSFKKWKGNLLVGSLAYTYLAKCVIENNKVVKETKLLDGIGRIRNVKQSIDGSIYVSVEGPGRIIRIKAE